MTSQATTETAQLFIVHEHGTPRGAYLANDPADALVQHVQDVGGWKAARLDATPAAEYADLVDRKAIDVSATSVDGVEDGAVEAEVTITAGSLTWSGGVTLYPDHGRPTVGRRHPLGTCGTPLDGWASDEIREALQVLGDDLIGEIEHAVDTAARKAGL